MDIISFDDNIIVKNYNKEEEIALQYLFTMMFNDPSQKEIDDINRKYSKLEHCEAYLKGAKNFKCGLPKGHTGHHCFLGFWDEEESLYIQTPNSQVREESLPERHDR